MGTLWLQDWPRPATLQAGKLKKLLLILLIATPAFAGKSSNFKDSALNQEFDRNYYEHSFPNWVNARGSSATITYINTSTITAIGFTATSSTMTNVKITGTAIIPWMTDWKSQTLAATSFGTISNNVMYCRRVGDSLECRFYFDAGIVAGATASITIPNSLSVDTAKLQANSKAIVGYFTNSAGSATQFFGTGIGGFLGTDSDATQIYFMRSNSDASNLLFVTTNASVIMNSNGGVGGTFTVPISGWTTNN